MEIKKKIRPEYFEQILAGKKKIEHIMKINPSEMHSLEEINKFGFYAITLK